MFIRNIFDGDWKMRKEELRRTLQENNVPPYLYNLDGTGRTDERLCLAFSHNTWYVFFQERSIKTMCERFASEDSACEFILRQLLRRSMITAYPLSEGGGTT